MGSGRAVAIAITCGAVAVGTATSVLSVPKLRRLVTSACSAVFATKARPVMRPPPALGKVAIRNVRCGTLSA